MRLQTTSSLDRARRRQGHRHFPRRALARSLAGLLAVTASVVLAACGGGTTGAPVAASSTGSATVPPAATAPPATATATAPTAASTTGSATQPQAQRTAARHQGTSAPGAVTTSKHEPATQAQRPAPSGSGSAQQPVRAPQQHQAATAKPHPAGTPIDELAQLTLTSRPSPAHYFQQGTVSGTYSGTMTLEARVTSQGVVVDFTATLPGGTIVGRGIATPVVSTAPMWDLKGTAAITGGTGRFAGIHGRGLQVTGKAKPDATRARVRLAGTVAY